MRATHLAAASLVLALALVGCGGGDDDDTPTDPTPTAPTTATVEASGSANTFTPDSVRIARGGTVTWTFGSPRPHNVIFTAGQTGAPANVDGSLTNTSVARTFGTAGTYNYICGIHGAAMSGKVVVQ